ncbi:MAG: SLC13 family permease [Pseudomonadota bacterium]
MAWEAALTLTTLAGVIGLLALTRLSPDLVLMTAVIVLMVSGVLAPVSALAGFANPGVITIAALYIVAAGLKDTGAVNWLARALLGQPRGPRRANFRLVVPTGIMSAFMNNTAVVAMFIPAVKEWARWLNIAPSKLLIPLSYAAILGGTCTLIGTSTNLVVDGLLQTELGLQLSLFEIAWVGVPLLIVGTIYLVLVGPWLLPDHGGVNRELEEVREYGVEVEVEENGPLVGKNIIEAGLRHLNYGYLAEIERQERLLAAVEPHEVLQAGDMLYFVGAPECAAELRRIQGLRLAEGHAHTLEIENHQRCLVEVVLGSEFAALGETVRDSQFRSRFGAVILSVSRNGQRVAGKLGDIEFALGDTLLLEASDQFVDQYRFRRDFLLVSALNDSTPPDYSRAPRALAVLAAMVAANAFGLLSIVEAALVAAGAMIATGCVTAGRARRSFDLPVLVVIAASFALGRAMSETGVAEFLAGQLLGTLGQNPVAVLAGIYLTTVVFTEMMTNNAAAVLMFSIAMATAQQLGVAIEPFAIAVMVAASASFITPLGYQTNLMVYGPGRYRFLDFAKIGLPLSALIAATAITLIPQIWAF